MQSFSTVLLSSIFVVLIGSYILAPRTIESMEGCSSSPESNEANLSVLKSEVKDLSNNVEEISKAVSKNTNSVKDLKEQVRGFQKAALYKAKNSNK